MSTPSKVVLVTNATEFVGPPAVAALSAEGMTVVVQDRLFADASARAEYVSGRPGVDAVAIEEPERLIEYVYQEYGGLDVLVSNDAFPAIHAPVEQAAVGDLQSTLEHLVVYPFRLMQAAMPRLKAARKGSVIMITSCRTELPQAGGSIPDMARAAANALVKTLSIELAPFDVPVNAIAPNYLYSETYFPKEKFSANPAGRAFIESAVPAGRLGDPAEVGELVRYLANLPGVFHTGSIIKFAGGWPVAPSRPD